MKLLDEMRPTQRRRFMRDVMDIQMNDAVTASAPTWVIAYFLATVTKHLIEAAGNGYEILETTQRGIVIDLDGRLDEELSDFLLHAEGLSSLLLSDLNSVQSPHQLRPRNWVALYDQLRDVTKLCLRTMPYKDYLQTEHWTSVRRRALEFSGDRCQLCNLSGVTLHVHHRTYDRLGDELDGDLIVLCAACHSKFHDKLV
jgi:hypothetical protein